MVLLINWIRTNHHLWRNVALDLLPEEFSNGRQAPDRFRREARDASAIHHPLACVGRFAGPEVLARIERRARSVDGVPDIHRVRAELVLQETVCAAMDVMDRRSPAIEQADHSAEQISRCL